MKKFCLLLALAAFLISCNDRVRQKSDSGATNTDLIQMNLKGKVQNLTEMTYAADSSGKMGKMDSMLNVYEFDNKGYMSKYYTKDPAGTVKVEQTFTRFDNGSLKELTSLKDGKPSFRLVTEVDKDGKYTGGKTYDSTGKQDSYYRELKTNEYGNVYAGKQYDMKDKIKATWDMKYDKAIFIGGTSTDSSGKTNYTGNVELNDKGDPIKETSTTMQKDSAKTEKFVYKYDTYDDKGNWVQRTTYNEKEKPSKFVKRTLAYYKD